MDKTYFAFGAVLAAAAYPRLDNETIRTLWKGFCFQAGTLELTPGAENTFVAGVATLPCVPEGKEFALRVTPEGVAVAGRDYAGLVHGLEHIV